VVPTSYLEFMITSAGAAGAMIGLLFVAISLRSDLVFGEHASAKVKLLPAKVKTLAGSSFTGLVNAFSLSILAIVPSTNIGVGMITVSLFCLYNTISLHRKARGTRVQLRVLVLSVANYATEFAGGVTLAVRIHETWIVNGLCYVIFVSFIIALNRAWALIQSETTIPEVA
jgi:hypothetical protein